MTKWIRALEYQADVVRGGCGMTIISDKNCSSSSPQGKGRGIKEKYRPPTLEANLEATMLRLERLESDLKSPSQNSSIMHENNRGSNKNNRDRRNSYDSDRENRNNESESESTSKYLRPEDVSLYDKRGRIREKMEKKNSLPKNKRSTEEKYPDDNDLDVVSGQGWKQDSPKHSHRNHGNSDNRNNNGHDRNGYDRDHLRKKNYLHDSDEDDEVNENKHRSRSEPLFGSVCNGDQQRSSSSNFSQGRGPEGRHKDHYGDDSLEEIPMHSKKNQRIRSQVQGHRDRDRNDDKNRSQNDRNGKGKGKTPPLGHISWGYDDDIYGTKREGSFEGNVSSRENQALHIAAGKAIGRGSLRSDSGGSGTNSYRSHRR
jgi:hypothetical protein